MKLLTMLKRFFLQRQKFNLIIVGTDYPSYQLSQKIAQFKRLIVCFFINEEPWANKTRIGDISLRYPSELLALVKKHSIDAVLCMNDEDFNRYSQDYSLGLAQHDCLLLMTSKEINNQELWEKINKNYRNESSV
jgi:FlaA1/EpsC-like NDP-sugar epimerase